MMLLLLLMWMLLLLLWLLMLLLRLLIGSLLPGWSGLGGRLAGCRDFRFDFSCKLTDKSLVLPHFLLVFLVHC